MTALFPHSRWRLRLLVYAGLCVFGLLGSAGFTNKLIWVGGMAILLGTFREARIDGSEFARRMVISFVPMQWNRWPIDRFVAIETRYGGASVLDSVFRSWWPFAIWFALFDWLIPWMGGAYELRLKLVRGGRVLAWRGNSDRNFEANLASLETLTCLPVVSV